MIEEIKQLKEQAGLSDRDVIGTLFQEMDNGKDFVEGSNNYTWFYHMGQYFRPKTIVEMGTRFGYSLKCFVEGANHPPSEYSLWVYDAECDGIKTLDICQSYFNNTLKINGLYIHRCYTSKVIELGISNVDLVMVDGEHTAAGCIHECELGWKSLRSGGVMVVDDIDNPMVKAGALEFCNKHAISPAYIAGLREMYLLIKP